MYAAAEPPEATRIRVIKTFGVIAFNLSKKYRINQATTIPRHHEPIITIAIYTIYIPAAAEGNGGVGEADSEEIQSRIIDKQIDACEVGMIEYVQECRMSLEIQPLVDANLFEYG